MRKSDTKELIKMLSEMQANYFQIDDDIQLNLKYGIPDDQEICDRIFKIKSDAILMFQVACDAEREWGTPTEIQKDAENEDAT